MLVSSKKLFQTARERNFAIPQTNFVDQLTVQTYTEVASDLNLPIILGYAEGHKDYLSLEEAALIGKFYAEKANAPVVLHLDHGKSLETIESAIDAGFTSVMIDASAEAFSENVRQTKEVVAYAHAKGIVVEAEIGHVGTGTTVDGNADDSIYTTVEEAKAFSEATSVDSLAISIGTAHGAYTGVPHIHFKRLEEIVQAIPTALVLHGGSSTGEENLEKCVRSGIVKINIYTDFIVNAYSNMKYGESQNYFDMKQLAKKGIRSTLERYLDIFQTKRYLNE